jgi:hypothetical protein
VRELGPFILLVCACGAAVRQAPPSKASTDQPSGATTVEAAASSASANTAEATTAFQAMAAQAASIAPGMREVARKESEGQAVDLVRADARDVCIRVAYESTAPVVARLVERSGSLLAAGEAPTTTGVLGARGPVCVRRGEVVRGLADGAGARVRWMVWEAH